MQIDVGARPERRQFPMVGINQRKHLHVGTAVIDALDNGPDRGDGSGLHRAFLTTSPTRTVPPFKILQLSPERLIKGSKMDLPVISSICRHGIDNRVASSRVSPSQNCRPTRWVSGTPSTVTLRRCSSGPRSILWSRFSAISVSNSNNVT